MYRTNRGDEAKIYQNQLKSAFGKLTSHSEKKNVFEFHFFLKNQCQKGETWL